jgi:mono/diheme cytochrome c family protein
MLKRAAIAIAILAVAAVALGWFLTAPEPLQSAALPNHSADRARGELVFYAAGCRHCHTPPNVEDKTQLNLSGGGELQTPFGVFRVPNITPDPETGIGGWSPIQFVNAVTRGVSPGGAHYYPAFPYASYAKMRIEDVLDLKAFMDGLPPVRNEVAGHTLGFPYNVRRGLGLWKQLHVTADPVLELAGANELVRRGQYLVEGPGHCGECHTARDFLGGLKTDTWLAGAPNPVGRGRIPNLTPHEDGLQWSASEIADTLKSGYTPDFDTLGGPMAAVQEDLAHLPIEDLQAIAAYLKAIPPLPDAVPRSQPSAD